MDECKKGGVCNWVEEYYGWRCTKCGRFYPYDHAPWDEDEDGNAIADEPFPLDELKGNYRIVYADPPWPHYGDPNKNAAAGKHYALMPMAKIIKLPVRSIMAPKAALFLWATGPRLDLALDTIRAWNLHYRGILYIWVKVRKDGEIINGQGIPPTFTKPTTELLLAATTQTHGRPFPIRTLNQPQVVFHKRGRHSEKPAIFRELILDLCGRLPRIELFAREKVPGWDCWGNEVR